VPAALAATLTILAIPGLFSFFKLFLRGAAVVDGLIIVAAQIPSGNRRLGIVAGLVFLALLALVIQIDRGIQKALNRRSPTQTRR